MKLLRFSPALLLLLSFGCAYTPNFNTGYDVESASLLPSPVEGTLVVEDFKDLRPERLYTNSSKMFMTYIPLLPYVKFPYERLEESIRINSDRIAKAGSGFGLRKQPVAPPFSEYAYGHSFPAAIAEDLKASGIFTDVTYGGSSRGKNRYLLEGTIRETPFYYSASSYMIGVPGVLLWILPIPMSKSTGITVIDLELTDTRSGRTVWTHQINSKSSRIFTMYSGALVYGPGGPFALNVQRPSRKAGVDRNSLFSWHFAALREGMMEAKASLAEAMAEQR